MQQPRGLGLTDISIPVPPQAKYGNRWATVAEEMPGRTGQQCAQRWRHKVNPNIRKDKWRDDEERPARELFCSGAWERRLSRQNP